MFCSVLARAVFFVPPEPEIPAPAEARGLAKVAPGGYPVRLRIPVLGIDANVQDVGIAQSGHMAVPNNYTDVGWYRYGPAPGSQGSAVIDGHVDNGLSLPGVFKKLNEIALGDEIVIRTARGAEYRYAVTDIELYDYRQVPVEQLFDQSGPARLALITCDGAWVAGEKTYDHRLVVYAALTS